MKLPSARILAVCALLVAAAALFIAFQPRLSALAAGPGSADSPDAITSVANTLNYQGILRDDQGALVTGSRDMTFKIYNDPVATAPANLLFTQTISNVPVRDGLFTVVLGDPTPIGPTVFADGPRFIGITVAPDPQEMLPRQRLHPVPWAQQATLALTANNATQANNANTANTANTLVPGATISADASVYKVLILQSASTIGAWLGLNSVATGGKNWSILSTGNANSEGPGKLLFHVDGAVKMTMDPAGNVGIGTVNPSYKLDVSGKVRASSGFNGQCNNRINASYDAGAALTWVNVNCNQDVAETFATMEQTEPGDLVVLLPESRSRPTVRRSPGAYDAGLVGVVSTNPGLVFDQGQTYLAGENTQLITAEKTVVAMVGRVPVKFSLENGPIAVGDPLTSSSTPGVAMKATQAGQIIGYAMQSSDEAAGGKLLVWLQLGHYLPPQLVAALNNGASALQNAAALKTQNEALTQQVASLKADNAAMDARLTALERNSGTASLPLPWLGATGLGVVGLVVGVGFRRVSRSRDQRGPY
ncbi:MAG: hypothetical protein U0822_02930 [Anaerolineae bacterium]